MPLNDENCLKTAPSLLLKRIPARRMCVFFSKHIPLLRLLVFDLLEGHTVSLTAISHIIVMVSYSSTEKTSANGLRGMEILRAYMLERYADELYVNSV